MSAYWQHFWRAYPIVRGVALGVDRLLMCQQKLSHMDATLAFSWSRA